MGIGDDRDVQDEIEFHLDRATAENLAKGMPPAEARAEAIRRFGDLEKVRRECLAARGRTVPPVLAWSAVAALAAVSFLAGYGFRERPASVPYMGNLVVGRLERDTARFVLTRPTPIAKGRILDFEQCPSPFREWRWRDGVPEVTFDGREWYTLFSAGGVPAADLREDHRNLWALPEGTNFDKDPWDLILENPRCGAGSVEVVLRKLADGSEVRVALLKGTARWYR